MQLLVNTFSTILDKKEFITDNMARLQLGGLSIRPCRDHIAWSSKKAVFNRNG